MGKAAVLFLLLGLAFYPFRADAEFYRYTDENGVLRFTDNLQEVPPDQRPQLKKYKEAEDDLTPAQRAAKRQREAEEARKTQIRRQQQKKVKSVEDIRVDSPEDFERVKTNLDDEYESLMRKKAALEEERNNLKSTEEVSAYRVKVRELNEEIKRFEDRRSRFIKKADQFNTRKK
ncbi:MAG: DUF4124 domain-containing protein [Desulfobacterales bacterium]|jgi:hypothetical protein